MKIVVTDLLRKVEIETQPGESPPSILAVDFSQVLPEFVGHRIRIDTVHTERFVEFPLPPAAAVHAVAPIADTDQPAATDGDVPQHTRVAEWEACEPGQQAVS